MMGEVKSYTLPAELVGKIAQILSSLPYGQVAAVASRLGQLVKEQQDQANAKPKMQVPKDTLQ